MKIEIEATGSNVETMLSEYMQSMTPGQVMARVASAALAQSRAEPFALSAGRNAYGVMWGAFADWAAKLGAEMRYAEDAAFEASEGPRKIGQTRDAAFAMHIADAIATLAK